MRDAAIAPDSAVVNRAADNAVVATGTFDEMVALGRKLGDEDKSGDYWITTIGEAQSGRFTF